MSTTTREFTVSDEDEALVREAYAAYAQGDTTKMLALVHPDLAWTYLDPAEPDPEPQTCHGRPQLLHALRRQAEAGLVSVIEEMASAGDQILVVVHTPGVDQHRARPANDRNYLVLTLRQRQIIAMRACRDRAEAAARLTRRTTNLLGRTVHGSPPRPPAARPPVNRSGYLSSSLAITSCWIWLVPS